MVHSFCHLWRGSMKLKPPVVFSLTSICHCNLNGGKRETWKEKQRLGWREGIFSDPRRHEGCEERSGEIERGNNDSGKGKGGQAKHPELNDKTSFEIKNPGIQILHSKHLPECFAAHVFFCDSTICERLVPHGVQRVAYSLGFQFISLCIKTERRRKKTKQRNSTELLTASNLNRKSLLTG